MDVVVVVWIFKETACFAFRDFVRGMEDGFFVENRIHSFDDNHFIRVNRLFFVELNDDVKTEGRGLMVNYTKSPSF